jgi:predicted Fe-Mo cluster-binding NifX family protein
MRIAIPVWEGQVSPVFDVAKTIRVTDIDCTKAAVTGSEKHPLKPTHPVATLVGLGVEALVCSAISAPLETALAASGIEVISDICGSPDEIIGALITGDLELRRFRSPGSRHEPKWSPAARRSLAVGEPRSSG